MTYIERLEYFLTQQVSEREKWGFIKICIEVSIDNAFYENLPQLTEEANVGLKGAVSMKELYKAIQSMEPLKASGISGFPFGKW